MRTKNTRQSVNEEIGRREIEVGKPVSRVVTVRWADIPNTEYRDAVSDSLMSDTGDMNHLNRRDRAFDFILGTEPRFHDLSATYQDEDGLMTTLYAVWDFS